MSQHFGIFFSFEILFHIIMIIIVLSHTSCSNLSLLYSAVVVNANRTIILTLQDEKWETIITQSKSWLLSHVPKRPRSATDKYSDLTETCWLAVINSRNTDWLPLSNNHSTCLIFLFVTAHQKAICHHTNHQTHSIFNLMKELKIASLSQTSQNCQKGYF